MNIKTVGIVGYGSFGTFVHELLKRFAPNVEVRVSSSRHQPDGKIFFTLEDVAASDAVVLCVPISAYEKTLKQVAELSRKDAVIIDVATVKVHTLDLLKKYCDGRPYLSTHPMFGPESYEKKQREVNGLRIVMCAGTIPIETYVSLIAFLRQCGFDVIEMTADEHDKHLAETLFLTHFIGQIIHRAGFDRTAIDTVSFGYLMDAVESVKHDEQLFTDVFMYNPYCRQVIDRFGIHESEVRKLLNA
jgi:prephenate dehydrogenase